MSQIIAARWAWTDPLKAGEREAAMNAHKEHLARAPFLVLLSGPHRSDTGESGALIIAKVDNLDAFRRFNDGDPFVTNGVYGRVEIVEWGITRGSLRNEIQLI